MNLKKIKIHKIRILDLWRQVLDVCWWAHVSNWEVLQWSGLSTVADILRHRRLSLAILHAWTLDWSSLPALMVETKAESQWPAGADHRAALAMSASTRFRRMPTLYMYCYLRCRDLRSPGVTEQRNSWTVHSDYVPTTTMMMTMNDERLVSKMEGKTNFSRRLQAVYGTGIVDCLEIIDVGCNLKQFDGLTRQTLSGVARILCQGGTGLASWKDRK